MGVQTERNRGLGIHRRALKAGSAYRAPNSLKLTQRAAPKEAVASELWPRNQTGAHIVPLSKGGRDDPSNMQWLPKGQHQDKTKRDLRP
jgi:hypothetical protein